MEGAQFLKRIPRIKFPQRRPFPYPSGSAANSNEASAAGNSDITFFSNSAASSNIGGKAALQPKRTPVSNEEIEAILLGGCI